MTLDPWHAALHVDSARRDREIVLAGAIRLGMAGGEPPWAELSDPELRRRSGYLLDVAQHLRGQTAAEATDLDRLRVGLGPLRPGPFWPGERPLPPDTDPIAARWSYSRGLNLLRLRTALARPTDPPPI
jgi:hypothetical protein